MSIPLAEILRPQEIDQYIGQEHLMGEGAVLHQAIKKGSIPSMILWGPPGVGKTTLANLISKQLDRPFYSLSAVHAGVKDVREIIDKAKYRAQQTIFSDKAPILFIDEIHRFNKSQQDSLLNAIEKGYLIFIGATTENPSFEVINPLLSRCQVYILKELSKQNLEDLLLRAQLLLEKNLAKKIIIQESQALLRISGGDGRKLLNAFELVVNAIFQKEEIQGNIQNEIIISNQIVETYIQNNLANYDKDGENHYDIISAFIKSIRGSDPNAAIYYLARMLQAGEDVKFIARRLVILAAEDIGLANPNGLLLANACFDTVHKIGYPESRIPLAETVIYLATSPKSNSAYEAINAAMDYVKQTGNLSIPLHIRNAPTKLMKDLDYGKDYKYAHHYAGNFIEQEFLPEQASGTRFYNVGNNPKEEEIRQKLKRLWNDKYSY